MTWNLDDSDLFIGLLQVAEAARFVDADDDRLRADLGVHVAGRAGGLVDLLPLPVGPHRRLPHPRPRLVHLRLGPHPHRPGILMGMHYTLNPSQHGLRRANRVELFAGACIRPTLLPLCSWRHGSKSSRTNLACLPSLGLQREER